ncbi:MAG TPA: MarR family transcriptional regulator [Intrasporangium sp.]|uniref:MarR family winged helix-turn-helix transcriptional regulator n=1 Tax=Intrasporangium sp. TaxID=1925024 RepID=UPI002D77740B|nr:MarR family transcriptional regulator [Intrasporangium sp.]HET7398836.1 MarR family transcriptional regulator [Intrasporangium sp.]
MARRSAAQAHRRAVAAYVADGGQESVQRVLTAVYGVTKRLDQWYTREFADLGLTHGEWAVLATLARAHESAVTPSQLAVLTSVGPSSMTHRLDRMAARGLVERSPDPANRTRTHVRLTAKGWDVFSAAITEGDPVESDTLRGLSTEERTELARLLETVIAGLDDVDAR